MKRIALKSGIACCLIFLFSSYTNAQFTLTLSEAKKVLSEKILDLDPVEGIYDVQNTVVVSQPRYGSETHKQHFTWAIVKVDRFWEPGENGKDAFFVISISGSVKGAMGVVEKLGAESYYTFWGADGKGRDKYYRFQLENMK